MEVRYLFILIVFIELWNIGNSAICQKRRRPPPAKHYIDQHGKISGDGGPTGLNWPNCVIPYFIDQSSYDYASQQHILKIMEREYHQKTCIRFRPWQQGDTNWIEIKHQFPGCSALVGMQRSGGQLVNLAPNCIYDVIITHELMHAVGFNHQHIAYNRDNYIVIHWENIQDEMKFNFYKEKPEDNQDGPYGFDFTSAMMYGRLAFSKNKQPVMDARPPYKFDKELYGNDYGLVPKDVQKIRLRYQNVCSCYQNSWSLPGKNCTTSQSCALMKLPVKVPTTFPG